MILRPRWSLSCGLRLRWRRWIRHPSPPSPLETTALPKGPEAHIRPQDCAHSSAGDDGAAQGAGAHALAHTRFRFLGVPCVGSPSSPAEKRSREPRRLVREQRVVTVVLPAPARPTSPRLLVLRVTLAQQAAHSSTKSTCSCGASDSDHAERRRVIDGRLLSFYAEPVWTDRVRRGMSGRCLVSTRLSRPAGCLRSQDSSVQPIGSPGSMGSDRARDTNYDADSGYSVAPPGTTRMSRGVPCRSDLPSPPRDRERRPSP
jgi:hypothetical protein